MGLSHRVLSAKSERYQSWMLIRSTVEDYRIAKLFYEELRDRASLDTLYVE